MGNVNSPTIIKKPHSSIQNLAMDPEERMMPTKTKKQRVPFPVSAGMVLHN
jgi:hypothetical protein